MSVSAPRDEGREVEENAGAVIDSSIALDESVKAVAVQ